MIGGFNLSEWALRHRTLVWFFMLIILIAGTRAYFNLGRNEDPPFTFRAMVVQVYWPGASVNEMIDQVTDRIERKLQETPGLDFLKSYTEAGRTTIFVNLTGATPGSTVPDIWYQVRKKVGDIKRTLPDGVIGPFFNDEFGDTYAIIYAFTADGFTHRELRDFVQQVRSELLHVPDVAKVDTFGEQDEKIYIEFDTRQLAGLDLDRQALLQALQAQNAVVPAGVVTTQDQRILVEVSGRFESEDDLAHVNFVANGHFFRLSDIATVIRRYSDPPQPMFRVNGLPAVGLGISMTGGGDVLTLGHNVEETMRSITADLPVGIEPVLVAQQPKVVEEAVNEFLKALKEALAIVLVVSFASLGLRAGSVVALSIPLVLAATFVAMDYFGINLQRISLGALIIALGLLVDDAMITVEMMITKIEEGFDLVRAATFAYTSTAFPMLTGTLITVAAFLPVGFAKSNAGEYTFSMFAVVAIALLISWIVAVLFAPLIGVSILSKGKGAAKQEAQGPVMRCFRNVLVLAMRARWVTIGTTLLLLALAIFATRFVSQQFFPSSDRPELLVDLTLPRDASIYATDAAAKQLDALLGKNPDVDHWTTYVGQGAVRFYLPLNVQLANDFFAQAVVVTTGLDARDRLKLQLDAALATDFPGVVARTTALELGPPVGWPLQYRIAGPDTDRIREIAYKVGGIVGQDTRVKQILFDWIEPIRKLRIRVDQDQARLLGISSQALAQSLNTIVSGFNVTDMLDEIYQIDVITRAGPGERASPENLGALQVPLPNGRTVPLSEFATLEYGLDWPQIWRRNRVNTITLQADLADGVLPATVVSALRDRIVTLQQQLPPGYSIVAGGSEEESAKSQGSVIAVLPVAAIVMLVILMIQLQSFNRLFLVLSVVPFGVIGVVAALLVSGRPMGFVAMLGVIALTGMIVRNSVILVDQIETEIRAGRSHWDAVVEATAHRFRPILLTAAAAILGMIPIAPTVFWGPMAFAIMGGLAVATALTLVFLPALYVAWFRIRAPASTVV